MTFVAIALHATAEHWIQLRGVYCPHRDYPTLPPVPGPSTRCDTRVTGHDAGPGAEGHILLAKRRRHGATGSLPMCLRAPTHACCTQLLRGLRCGDGEPPGAHGSVVCLCPWWCVCVCVCACDRVLETPTSRGCLTRKCYHRPRHPIALPSAKRPGASFMAPTALPASVRMRWVQSHPTTITDQIAGPAASLPVAVCVAVCVCVWLWLCVCVWLCVCMCWWCTPQ